MQSYFIYNLNDNNLLINTYKFKRMRIDIKKIMTMLALAMLPVLTFASEADLPIPDLHASTFKFLEE